MAGLDDKNGTARRPESKRPFFEKSGAKTFIILGLRR
jgi:hypothetical protein